MGDSVKICSKCKHEKPLSQFPKDKTVKSGIRSSCSDCKKKYDIEYQKTDLYKRKVRKNLWKHQNIDITYEQYEKMFKEQNGRCAICDTSVNQFNKGLCVDHCHKSSKIRGLLCTKCNAGLGSFNDDLYLLHKAFNYLQNYIKE